MGLFGKDKKSSTATAAAATVAKETKGLRHGAWKLIKFTALAYAAERVGEHIYEGMTDSEVVWDFDMKNKHISMDVVDNHIINEQYPQSPVYTSPVTINTPANPDAPSYTVDDMSEDANKAEADTTKTDTNNTSNRGYEGIVEETENSGADLSDTLG